MTLLSAPRYWVWRTLLMAVRYTYVQYHTPSLTDSAIPAASDTTTSTLTNFVYFMVTNPDIQQRAQQQIDAVVGKGRLPTFGDRVRLPYIDAIIHETLRLRSPVPLSVPHAATEDDHYKGYHIPKGKPIIAVRETIVLLCLTGTVVLANVMCDIHLLWYDMS